MDERDIILEEMKKQEKKLWQIDVREAMLDDIFGGKENWESRHSELTKWRRPFFKEKLREDIEKYYSDKTNILEKIDIGKYWANRNLLDYDYDASDLANAVYNMAFFEGKGKIEPSHGYEYVLVVDGVKYRGDTMNSWSRTVNQLKKREYPLPSYVTCFLEVVYTIGNFIPVPTAKIHVNFNLRRNVLCMDYWDATLLSIYNYYTGKGENSEGWKKLFQYEGNKRWLERYGNGEEGWHNFVEENFLQDFVLDFDKGDLCPISLKNSKLKPESKEKLFVSLERKDDEYNLMPQTSDEFENFFTVASFCIRERGKRIWEKIENTV